jgi:hypothetical protein
MLFHPTESVSINKEEEEEKEEEEYIAFAHFHETLLLYQEILVLLVDDIE